MAQGQQKEIHEVGVQFDTPIPVFNDFLSQREQKLVRMTTDNYPYNKYTDFINQVRDAVLSDNLSEDPTLLDQQHLRLSRFYQALAVNMDNYFDTHREEFKQSMKNSGDLFRALQTIVITQSSETFTIQEMYSILGKSITNLNLYTNNSSREIIKGDLNELIEFALHQDVSTYEQEPTTLSSNQVLLVKKSTIERHSQLVFDLECGDFCEQPQYNVARKRYKAAAFGYQFRDDVIDFPLDSRQGVANLLRSFSRETGEESALLEAVLEQNFSVRKLGFDNYCKRVNTIAPHSYQFIALHQRELFDQVGLPNITSSVTLPVFD